MSGTLAAVAGGALAWLATRFNGQQPLLSSSSSLVKDLGDLVPNAKICLPDQECWTVSQNRWIAWRNPHFDVIVHPSTQEDVEQVVKLANIHNVPFLAISGGHGSTDSLKNFEHGVGINLNRLTQIELTEDGTTATMGGGVLSGDVSHGLWAMGKQTVSGCCECTGATAPMLGGGHGWLQGRYGKMSDNLISANVVLANGSSVRASESEHTDLFWALQGAGHNFGIVTSWEEKVYDHHNETWAYEHWLFPMERVEEVFAEANRIVEDKNKPVDLIHWGLAGRFPGLAEGKVVIMYNLMYQGSAIPSEHTTPLKSIKGGVILQSGTTTLPNYAKVAGWDFESAVCAKTGPIIQRFPTNLEKYSISGMRKAVNFVSSLPVEFNASALIFEGFGTSVVQEVPNANTAYAGRNHNLLLSPFITYAPGDEQLDKRGEELGREIARVLVESSGKKLGAYVNYAHGYESLEEVYGYEEWRLEKLRRLKKEWDPENRVRWYNPIP